MKKTFVGLMPFESALSGEASALVGAEKLTKFNGTLPTVTDGDVIGMPEKVEGTTYVVNAIVFNALSGSRDDVAMFDPAKAVRFDSGDMAGKVKSQGGFIFS